MFAEGWDGCWADGPWNVFAELLPEMFVRLATGRPRAVMTEAALACQRYMTLNDGASSL